MNELQRKQAIMDIAAQIMDEKCPDWFNRIDFDGLQMWAGERCIAGQCGLAWKDLLGELHSRLRRKRIGYCISAFACEESVPYWREAVMERKYPQAMEIGTPEKEYTVEPAEPVPGIKESPAPTPEPVRREPVTPEREKVPA